MTESGKPSASGKTPNDPASPVNPAAAGAAPDRSSRDKKAKTPKVKQRGRWRRRFVRTFMAVVLIGLIFQIALWSLLPWALRRAAKSYDLDLTCDRPDFSLFNSDAGLWHVKVTQHGQPVASVDYCRADISIADLFRGRLDIQRLEADGVDLTVQRDADGSIPLLKGILFAGPQTGTTPAPKAPGASSTPIDLRSPVAIDALLLTHVRTHIVDHAVQPELNTEVQMNLRLTDVGSPLRPLKFSMQLIPTPLSTPLLDSIVLEAGCKKVNDGKSVDAYFNASARGLHPKLLEGYLSPFGVRVKADGVGISAHGNIAINVIPQNPQAITGTINFTELALTADGQDAATMKSVVVNLDSVSETSAVVKDIALADGSFVADRTAAGGFRVAGFEFTPGTATAESEPKHPTPPSPNRYLFTLGEFSLTKFRASFKDAAVQPAADVEFVIESFAIKDISNDPGKLDTAIGISGEFASPGIFSNAKIDGSCQAMATKKTFDLNVAASGIHPDALGPYFAMMGVDSDLKSARFMCKLTADLSLPAENTLSADARLTQIKFEDGQELVGLDDVKISGIGLTPGAIRIDSIDVSGPRAAARREKSGAIWAAGFRIKPPGSGPAAPPSTSHPKATVARAGSTTKPAASAETLAALPKIDIGRFSWSGVKLQMDDEAAPLGAATSLAIEDAGVELTGLHIDFDPKAAVVEKPAHLNAHLKAPGLAGELKLDGTIAQRPGGLVADLEVSGQKLSAALAAPYLKALNIEPVLHDGSVHARAHVDVAQAEDGIAATVRADDFQLRDPTGELLGADQAAIDGIHLTANALEIGEVSLKKPRGQFSRDKGGAINAVGFRLLPVPPQPKKSAFAAAPVAGNAPATAQPAGNSPATQPAEPSQVIVLKKFSIRDGTFAWADGDVTPAAQIVGHVNGVVSDVVLGGPGKPSQFVFSLAADGIVDHADAAGMVRITPDSATLKLAASASGIRQGALASYLPPGMSIELKNGQFKAPHVEAEVSLNPKGGAAGKLIVSSLDYRDDKSPTPLFALESVKVIVPRIDLPEGVIDVDEISVAGAETSALMGKDGVIHALGIAIASTTQPAPATQPTKVALAPTTMPAGPQGLTDAPDRSPSLAPLVVVKPRYPLITLKKLDLNLKRFTLTDQTRENVPPVTVSDLRLFSNKPIEALGKDAGGRPAIDLGLYLKVNGVVDSLNVNFQVAPFASEPTFAAEVMAIGIHGDGILAQAPDLKSQIDAGQLTEGRLHAHYFAKIKMDRFDPLEFPLDHAFDIDTSLKGVEFKAADKGPVLFGLEEVRSEGIHVQPADKLVTVKAIEIENIVGQATREKDGIHAGGIVLKVPAEATTQPAVAQAQAAPPPPAATTAPSPANDAGEIRINKILVSGLDFRVMDSTVSPPLLVPLNQLDLDVRNLSSRAFSEARPATRFSLLVGAAKVPLPAKAPSSANTPSVADAGKGPASKPVKADNGVMMEDRDLFSQVQADGELVFFPQPKGWLKASVSAFDLAEMSSTLKPFKVDLSNGVFDAAIDARLAGDGTMVSDSHFIFTDLDLSEPPNGPIQHFLQLPQPTNIVLGLLERPDGSIDVPLAISVANGKLTAGEITGAAVHAFGVIVGNAIASAPVKTANLAADAVNKVIPFSILFGAPKPKNNGPFTLTFAAGDDGLSAFDLLQLSVVIERMKEEPDLVITMTSDLSGGPQAASGNLNAMTGDIGRARLRANPSQEECRELINRLSRRKDDLIRRRIDVLGQTRSAVASLAPAQSSGNIEQLRAVERELSATEDALDRLYDLERPGANRQAGRRTKQAALTVARSRQRAITAYLVASGVTDMETRINSPHPKFAPAAGNDSAGGSVVITVTVKRKS